MATRQMTVNDSGAPETLSAGIPSRRIIIYELPTATGWPRKWQWRQPLATSDPAVVAEGGSKVFETSGPDNLYQTNEVVAYLELLAGGGSTTFVVIEE